MRRMNHAVLIINLVAFVFLVLGTSSAWALQRQGAGTPGGACKVVAGPNNGKTGKYDDEGACCGDWGCTECHGANQGKCQDARLKVPPMTRVPVQPPVAR